MSVSTYTVTIPAGPGALGLSLKESDDTTQARIEITRVDAAGRAASSGIVPQSCVTTLNGTNVRSMNLESFSNLLKSTTGQPLTLVLERPASAEDEDEDEEEEDNEDEKDEERHEPSPQSPTKVVAPADWGNVLHHQFGSVSNQVEVGLHSLKRVLQHIEKVTSLHVNLAKARKTATVVKPMEPDVEPNKDFLAAYTMAQELNLHATECLFAFSMAVTDQIITPGMKFYQSAIDHKRELDKQMKKRDELHTKLSTSIKKDLGVVKQELAALVTASEEKKAVEGKKFSDLTPEQQKVFNKLDGNKSKAQAKALKSMREYEVNFRKARHAQEDRMIYVRNALNWLRNIDRERMETSAIYMYRVNELYTTLISDLQKLTISDKLGSLEASKALADCLSMWQASHGAPPEDVLLDFGLPCSADEAEKDVFKSGFPEEMNKAKYAKEEYEVAKNEPVTGSGKLLEGYASALLASRAGKTTEIFDPARDELALRQRVEVVNLLRKSGNNLPFLEQVHLSQNVTRITDGGKKETRVFLMTDKAIYSLGEKLDLHRRISFESISRITISNNSNELRIHLKKGQDFHLASEKKQIMVDALHVFVAQYFRGLPELDAQFKKQQFFFYVDVQSLLKYKVGADSVAPVNITPGDEQSLTYTSSSSGVHAKDFSALGLLGQGTFGRVLLVSKNEDSKTFYAMKILNKRFLVTNDQVKNVKNEQQILTHVDHPFVLKAHYTFTGHEHIYMVLDYVAGGELYTHIKKVGKFSEDVARFIAAEISLGLGHLHSKNIIYRDLKPENVLLDEKGHAKIADFGTAKILEPGKRTHTFCGTPQYLSPEVVLGYGHDKAVDWWALGVLLYELTVGVAPFSDDNVKKLHEKIQSGVLKFPSSMSAACKDLIVALLNRSAKHRLGSNDDVEDVKKHEFFKGLDWEKLLKKELVPPFVPTPIKPARLTKAQQKEFRDEQSNSVLTLVPGLKNRANKKQAEIDANFRGFTWAANSFEEFAANSAKQPRRPGDTESVLASLDEAEEEKALAKSASPEGKKAPPPPPTKGPDTAALQAAEKEREKADKEKSDKIAAEREKAEREKAEREKAEREKAEREKTEREKTEREKTEREKAEREKAEREKAEREKAEKAAQEAAEAELRAAEKALADAMAKKSALASAPLWEVSHKGGLRVRTEPNKDAAEAGVLACGARVPILAQSGDWVQHAGGWCLTKTPNGKALMEPV